MIRKLLTRLTAIAFILTGLAGIIVSVLFYYGRGLPEYDYLKHYEPPTLTQLYSKDGRVFKEYAQERRVFVPLSDMPNLLVSAFLAAEDKNFFYHCGIDFIGMFRAVITNTATSNWHSRPVGGSTVTQQVAKNFLVGKNRSFDRKIKEAIMAFRLENSLSKPRILEIYLNQIYLGTGAYGVAAAAAAYFNKTLQELSLSEIAFLAALPKAPSFYPSKENLERAKSRRNWVIYRLVEDGIVSEEEGFKAQQEPITLSQQPPLSAQADYFAEEVRRFSLKNLGKKVFEQGGISILTTLDPRLQIHADEALRTGLRAYDRRHGWRGALTTLNLNQDLSDTESLELKDAPWLQLLRKVSPPLGIGSWKLAVVLHLNPESASIGLKDGTTGIIPLEELLWARAWQPQQTLGGKIKKPSDVLKIGDVIAVSPVEGGSGSFHLEQIPDVSGSVVVMDPQTGRVLALTGGYDFEMSQYNCATQARRQPGSAFKPFVYMAALEHGYTPNTKILDAPVVINMGGKLGVYAPKNYSREYDGLTPMHVGIEQSRNVMTIRLAQSLGMRCIEEMAKRFGVVDKLPRQLAMALGSSETTILRLTAAYAKIANGGRFISPYFIEQMYDRHNHLIYQAAPPTQQILAHPKTIQDITYMLQGVVQRGTAKRLQRLGIPIAGKTGTTNAYKDAWFIGFTNNLVVGVFVGFLSPKTLGKGETGGTLAVPIFENFMEKTLLEEQVSPPKMIEIAENSVGQTNIVNG